MKTTAEIWIDYRRAVITTITENGQTTSEVRVNQTGPRLFDLVLAAIGDAMTILIFGPSEARAELGRRLQLIPVKARVHVMGMGGKATERQLAERIRDHDYI